jgi:hypothetical protein
MSFNNPGGSIGSGLLVLLAGWCVHCVAKHLAAQAASNKLTPAATAAARQAGKLTVRGLNFLVRSICWSFLLYLISTHCQTAPLMQVAHSPVPYVLIDIRDDKSSKIKHKAVRFRDAVQLSEALSHPTKWQSICKGADAPAYPAASSLLIFVHDSRV